EWGCGAPRLEGDPSLFAHRGGREARVRVVPPGEGNGNRMILGLGMDLCEVDRVERLLQRDREHFLRRVFGEAEIAYCEARRRPAPHFAARFAAKEAFLKAVGTGWRLGWRQGEVGRVR